VFKHISDTHEPFDNKHEWIVITKLADVLATPLDAPLAESLRSFGDGIIEFDITSEETRTERWWRLRKNIAEAQKAEGISIKHDVSIPISSVPRFIAQASAALRAAYPGIRIVAFGHIGDGNIHYNISMLDAAKNADFIAQQEQGVNSVVYEVVSKLEGSISAEHGLGQLKREQITHYKSAFELELMRKIKQALDPNGLMNPKKVL
jgi:FAD/FMN-containing dehydrogenase